MAELGGAGGGEAIGRARILRGIAKRSQFEIGFLGVLGVRGHVLDQLWDANDTFRDAEERVWGGGGQV